MAVADYKKSKTKRERQKASAAQKRRRKRQRHKNQTIKDHNALGQYKGPIKPVNLDTTEEWKVSVLRKPDSKGRFKVARRIDDFVEGFDWLDEGPVLEGTLNFREPVKGLKDRAMIRDGDMVQVQVRGSRGGAWHEVWRMRCWGIDLAISTGTNSLPLKDDLANLQLDEGDYKFKKKKKGRRKKGWRAFEITRAVCKDARVRIGKLAKTRRWIEDLTMMKAHPLDVIIKAYQLEKEETGKSYVIKWRNGKLNIEPLRRNKWLYTLREQIVEALITHERSTDSPFYTVLTLSASKEKGGDSKKKEKLEVTVGNKAAMQQYGRIRHTDTVDGKVKNKAQLRKIAKRRLAKVIKKRTLNSISVTHPGIPWIRKGDAVRIKLPEYGFKDTPRPWRIFQGGHYSVLFVESVQHSVSAGSYTMDLTFGIEDPIAAQKASIREAKNKAQRDKKRDKKGKSRKEKREKVETKAARERDETLDQVIARAWKIVSPVYPFRTMPTWKVVPAGSGYMYCLPGPVGYRRIGISPNAAAGVKKLDPMALFALFHEWGHVGQKEALFNSDAAEGWANHVANNALNLWNERTS